MLVEFRVENHRSIREEQVLSLQAAPGLDKNDPRLRQVRPKLALLPTAAIYGANASGKTNILDALDFMAEAVTESANRWVPDQGVPRRPFAWGDTAQKPSFFEVTAVLQGTQYQYGFVADGQLFLEEWLYVWPQGRKQVWFERDRDQYTFGQHLAGDNRAITQFTRPNCLFLSMAVQMGHSQLAPLHTWFSLVGHISIGLDPKYARDFYKWQPHLIPRLATFLRNADLGIQAVELSQDHLRIRHTSAETDAWLDFADESAGTQALFAVSPFLLPMQEVGGLTVFDELEASLHPNLAVKVIELFNNPSSNPRNAQLIFTTHNTSLLTSTADPPWLRRDQVWFTEKDQEGATVLYPLTNFKPQKGENLEKGYLQGRYGAIPFLGDWTHLLKDKAP